MEQLITNENIEFPDRAHTLGMTYDDWPIPDTPKQWRFKGEPRGPRPQAPYFWQPKRGPTRKKKLKRNHRKTFEYTLEA